MRKGFFAAVAASMVGGSMVQAQSLPEPKAHLTFQPASQVTDSKGDTTTPTLDDKKAPIVFVDAAPNATTSWASFDYLSWRIKGGPVPALVTSGGAKAFDFGALGQPSTHVLFGEHNLDYDIFSGARLSGGFQVAPGLGVEGNYFLLERRTDSFATGTDAKGSPQLARPFFSVVDGGTPDASLISAPGAFSGSIGIVSHSRLQGGEINFTKNLTQKGSNRADLLLGFRYLDLNEDLSFSERNDALVPGALEIAPPQFFTVNDSFHTRNHFFGGQVGTRIQGSKGAWSYDLTGKVALGTTEQGVNIEGSTQVHTPGASTVNIPGGFLALPTNIGARTQDHFTVVPEVGLTLGYQISDNVKATVGYSFMYWSNVVRPGAQIDPNINGNLVPSFAPPKSGGPSQPGFNFQETDFWAQGINVGLQFSF